MKQCAEEGCTRPAYSEKALRCTECARDARLATHRAQQEKRRKRAKENGLCMTCLHRKPQSGATCDSCKKRHRGYQKHINVRRTEIQREVAKAAIEKVWQELGRMRGLSAEELKAEEIRMLGKILSNIFFTQAAGYTLLTLTRRGRAKKGPLNDLVGEIVKSVEMSDGKELVVVKYPSNEKYRK